MPGSVQPSSVAATAAPASLTLRRIVAVAIGTVCVALAAQVAVNLPGNPVPVTLQGLAVLLVGGLLGPRLGTAALVTYLAAGAAGLPVFAPSALSGIARLLGPTGGYLLAFPVAAGVTGALSRDGRLARSLLAALAGMVVIHLGGIAQLTILTGNLRQAMTWGGIPFFAVDLVKVTLAALLITRFRAPVRTLI